MEFLQNIEPREYQQKIFETCRKKNCLIVLPTGLGKTLIALMVTIDRMKKYPKKKVIFLAPTKPLIEQHLLFFKKHLPELFGEMQLFTGKIKAPERKRMWDTADIVFSTPQCIANDVSKGLYDLQEVSLLIEDEAHRCTKNYSYNIIAKKYMQQGKDQRIIGMTASPGSELSKIKEVCKNLSIEEVEARTRESEDVKGYLKELEFQRIEILFPKELEEIRQILLHLFDGYIDELRLRRALFGPATKTNLIRLQKKLSGAINRNRNYSDMLAASAAAQAVKIHHAIELLETQTLTGLQDYLKDLFEQASKNKSKGVVKLVRKPEFNLAYQLTTELITKGIEHPKIQKLVEIISKERQKSKKSKVIIFTQFRGTAKKVSDEINEIEGINSKTFVGQAKKKNTGLNQKEQKKIIEEFSEGKINVIVATSIAEEGLDIPEVSLVIFYEPIPSAIRAIQRAGRTARLNKGKLIILMTKKTRDEAYFHVSRRRREKMEEVIDKVKKGLGKKEEKQTKL